MWRMEDVLDLYAEPHDPQRPVVCFDEKPYQLLADVNPGLPAAPGRVRREDYEYERKGTCNLFIAFEPHTGQRLIEVTQRRGSPEFAQQMRALVGRHPDARVVRVVLDNLSTHSPAALYQSLPPHEARELTRRLEFHYTPRHGSWLNMAEVEWSALERQCLKRRVENTEALQHEVNAWQTERNGRAVTVNWRFRTDDARVKLARLYPGLEQPQ